MNKKPTHQEIAALLPWYVNQTLAEDEHDVVKAHLEDCDVCQGEIEHLLLCSQTIRKENPSPAGPANDAVARVIAEISNQAPPKKPWWHWLMPRLAPALSLACVAIVAVLFFYRPQGVVEGRFAPITEENFQQYAFLKDARGATNRFELGSEDTLRLRIEMTSEPINARNIYVCHLFNDDDSVSEVEVPAGEQVFGLEWSAADLQTGRYRLQISTRPAHEAGEPRPIQKFELEIQIK